MHGIGELVEAGGLVSYAPNFLAQWRQAAVFVDQIFKAVKPAELPIRQPAQFELVIDVKTAMSLGIEIPPELLARDDEVIE